MNITEEITTTTEEVVRTTAYISDLTKFLLSKISLYNSIRFYCQMTISIVCVPLNIYFIACILLIPNLRNIRHVLIVWQALCDIFSVGVFRLFLTIQSEFVGILIKIYLKYGLEGYILYQRDLPCMFEQFSQGFNEYSTGFVMLFYAVERFILIIYPLQAKTILTRRYYIICTAAIILVSATLIFAGAIVEWDLVKSSLFCTLGTRSFWRNAKVKCIADIVIFYAIPVVISSILYGFIAKKLLSKPKISKSSNDVQGSDGKKKLSEKEKRNRALTEAFMASTVAWIVLWSMFYSEEIAVNFEMRNKRDSNYWSFSKHQLRELLFSAYSIVNPICFIIINRQFQEPIRKLIRLLPIGRHER